MRSRESWGRCVDLAREMVEQDGFGSDRSAGGGPPHEAGMVLMPQAKLTWGSGRGEAVRWLSRQPTINEWFGDLPFWSAAAVLGLQIAVRLARRGARVAQNPAPWQRLPAGNLAPAIVVQ